MIVNPGFETGTMSGWSATFNIVDPHYGSYKASTSYQMESKWQTIDLLTSNFTAAELDAGFNVEWGEYMASNRFSDTYYYVQVQVLDASSNVIASGNLYSIDSPGTIPMNPTTTWLLYNGSVNVNVTGARYIMYKSGGYGELNWGEQYGTSFDDAYVRVVPQVYPQYNESEPNDTKSTANAISAVGQYVDVNGNITNGAVDWYRFKVYDGNNIWVSTNADNVNIQLYDATGNSIGSEFGLTSGNMYAHYVAAEAADLQPNWIKVTGTADGPYAVFIYNADDASLPVQLSSFTTTAVSNDNVALSWTTQTETDMLGYNVLRATSNDSFIAAPVNSALISATNGSIPHTYSFTDNHVSPATTYWYWLESIALNGESELYGPIMATTSVPSDPGDNDTPDPVNVTRLLGVFPNPFNPVAGISYYLAESSDVTLDVFDLRGCRVEHFQTYQSAGKHTQTWSAENCASGTYLIRMQAGKFSCTCRAVLMK